MHQHSQTTYTQVIKNFAPVQPKPIQGSGQGNGQRDQRRKQAIKDKKLDIYSIQKYNFDKFGLLLQYSKNKQLYRVRKERHFVDFSKIPKPDSEIPEKPEKATASFSFDPRKQLPVPPIEVSSRFDAAA